MRMQWVDELPGMPPQERRRLYKPREGSQDLHEHAAKLVEQPMRWAKYPRKFSARMAKTLAERISNGGLAAYRRDLGFEAVVRSGEIYVRHNPSLVDPGRQAFHAGYRKGVLDAVAKIRVHVSSLRDLMADIERAAPGPYKVP